MPAVVATGQRSAGTRDVRMRSARERPPTRATIGTRPTVDASGRTVVETHIFGLDRDLYGAPVRVGFVQRLRDERAFASVDLLRAQIDADCQRARVLFNRLSL